MQFFQWDPAFQTGSHDVDRQHQQLISILNRFGALLVRDAVGSGEIAQVCEELLVYAHYHFAEEEALMAASGLDQRHRHEHRQQHEGLFAEVQALRENLVSVDQAAGKAFFEFLVNWLVFHILGTDLLMARQLAAIRQGKTSMEAYLTEEQESRHATDLLLKAVKNLLYQISNRNRQLIELNEALEKRVEERTRELSTANQKLQELASSDGLTGTLNRRSFMEEAGHLFQLARRYRRPLALLMIDADHFKRVNDTYGHQAGDRVLIRLSELLRRCLRETDKLGRIGGEEFAVILPETKREQTAWLAERLLSTVRTSAIGIGTSVPLQITVSIGIATLTPQTADIDGLLKQADVALYQAKAAGRDRWSISP